MAVNPVDRIEEDEIPHVESPYAGSVLNPKQHIAISAYWFATNFHWGALLLILLPDQAKVMNPAYRAETLGLLTGISAIIAVVVPLIAGALSDRCASKQGRRRPWMATGMIINVIGLLLLALSFTLTTPVPVDTKLDAIPSIFTNPGIVAFFLSYLVVQLGNNIASAAYMGVIPDLVPENQRGIASGYMALMTQAGTLFGGIASGLLLSKAPEWSKYVVICAMLVGTGLITLFGMKETALPYKPPKIEWGRYLKSLWIDPRVYPDFAWVWITRALVMLGFYAVMPYVNYYLVDVIGIHRDKVGQIAPLLMGVILIAASITGVLGGKWSDKVGRKKVVYISNAAIAVFAVGFIFCRNIESALFVGVLFGLGYGAYTSVDYALGTDVLPSKKDAAKEMAVWHIAMTLPQSIAAPAAGFLIASFGKTVTPATKIGEEPFVTYTIAGYAAIFSLCALCFALGAYLLKNVRGAK